MSIHTSDVDLEFGRKGVVSSGIGGLRLRLRRLRLPLVGRADQRRVVQLTRRRHLHVRVHHALCE